MSCGCNNSKIEECVEENSCADSIFPSKKAAKFSVSEMLLNVFCAIRSIAFGITKIENSIVDRIDQHLAELPNNRSIHYEVWGFDEAIGEEDRKVCMVENTEVLKHIDIYSFYSGLLPVSLKIKFDGVVVKHVTLSSPRTKVIMNNYPQTGGSVVSFEASTSDVYGVTGWTHLACYMVY
jgi:hypothetical protein